ncbi:hypothetical protein JCM11641_005063 [Rhodosporidiobolus odoratus]
MSVPERPQQESSIASRVPSSATVAARTRAQTRPRHPARVPFFANAAQPEIVRANQKDLYYLSQLTERVEDVGRSLLGTRWLQKWGKELQGGSKLAYFGLTTLLGSQTLGEEYCDIKQYHRKDRKTPSLLRRTALVLLHVLFPYLLARIYANLRRALIARHESIRVDAAETDHLFQSPSPSAPEPGNKDRMVSRLAGIAKDLPSFETLIEDYLRSVHLAVFYLCGRYYSLSKRAIGVRFISMQGRRAASAAMTTSPAPSSYEVLGVLMAVQLLVRGILAYRKRRASASLADPAAQAAAELERRRKMQFTVDGKPLAQVVFDPDDAEQAAPYPPEDEGEGNGDGERRCTLCLGTRRDAAATECGHVFCWECVVGWAREKAECPLCRQGISLSKLLPLRNM